MAPLSAHLTSKLQKEFYTFDISLMDIEYLQNTNKVYHYIIHMYWATLADVTAIMASLVNKSGCGYILVTYFLILHLINVNVW